MQENYSLWLAGFAAIFHALAKAVENEWTVQRHISFPSWVKIFTFLRLYEDCMKWSPVHSVRESVEGSSST